MPEAAGTETNPIWMRLIKDEKGIKWGHLVVMLVFTVASGYLASQAQRAGGDADMAKSLKMRYHHEVMKYAAKRERFWLSVICHHHDQYDLARL